MQQLEIPLKVSIPIQTILQEEFIQAEIKQITEEDMTNPNKDKKPGRGANEENIKKLKEYFQKEKEKDKKKNETGTK